MGGRKRQLLLFCCCRTQRSFALQFPAPHAQYVRRRSSSSSSCSSLSSSSSPVTSIEVQGRYILVKRDDLFRDTESIGISGNKARKLCSLSKVPTEEFPSCVVSHGGPQSNSMLSLAAVVHAKGPRSRFVYYTKKLPRWLRDNPSGNYARALALGADVRQLPHEVYNRVFASCEGVGDRPAELDSLLLRRGGIGGAVNGSVNGGSDDVSVMDGVPTESLWVPQGGACADAEEGLAILAEEIANEWYSGRYSRSSGSSEEIESVGESRPGDEKGLSREEGRGEQTAGTRYSRDERHRLVPELAVVVPAGTGTTALFLGRHLSPRGIAVVAVPCVGDARGSYLRRQMARLDRVTGGTGAPRDLPLVLEPAFGSAAAAAAPFGRPRAELLTTWRSMNDESGLYLDLLYGARAWEVLLSRWETLPRRIANAQLMYLHCGGLEGISSQLNRYRHAGLIEAREVM